jgi:hypothetical protein
MVGTMNHLGGNPRPSKAGRKSEQLDLYCINTKQVRSEVIREAIKLYLSIKKIKKNFIEENHKNNEVRVQEI